MGEPVYERLTPINETVQSPVTEGPQVLKVYHLQGVFLVAACGYALAIIIFFIEMSSMTFRNLIS